MGGKINPINFRLYLSKCWNSKTFIDHFNYSAILHQDLYIIEYIKGVLHKFKMFYVNTIIKRVGTKTFLTVYYYRRPYFYKYNYKNFIKSQIRTKLLKKLKVNKFQSIPFLLNNQKYFNKRPDNYNKKFKYTTALNNLKFNKNFIKNMKKKNSIFFFKVIPFTFSKIFCYTIWHKLLQKQTKALLVPYIYNKFFVFLLNDYKLRDRTQQLVSWRNNQSLPHFFSLKKIIKFTLAKILNTRLLHLSLINISKFNNYTSLSKYHKEKKTKMIQLSRRLSFGFSKKFTILTVNLFQKAFKYKNVDLIAFFLAYLFKKNIRKPRIFFRFIKLVISYFYTFYKFEGIQIIFKGRINGSTRTRSVILKKR